MQRNGVVENPLWGSWWRQHPVSRGSTASRGVWGVPALAVQQAETSSLQPGTCWVLITVVLWRDFWLLSLPLFLSVF